MRTQPSDRFTYLGKLEPWFQCRFTTTWKRIIAKLVIVGVVCAAAGFAVGFTMDKAAGATVGSGAQYRCVRNGHEVACPDAFAVRKFKHGKMGRVHGVRPGRVWKHPKAAKKVWVRKIKHARAHGRVPASLTGVSAAKLYRSTMNTAACAGHGRYMPYSYGYDVCTIQGPETRLSTEDIQKMGTVGFCGGGVLIGALSFEAGGWMIGSGSASCLWGAWREAS